MQGMTSWLRQRRTVANEMVWLRWTRLGRRRRQAVVAIKPTRIKGRWREGFALDYHTLRSLYLGDDEYGHPQFETERSPIGELLYRLKYHSDTSVLDALVNTMVEFVLQWKPNVDVLVPVPPSRQTRSQQPVLVLAESLGKRLGIPVVADAISRTKDLPELKNVFDYDERQRLLSGAYTAESSLVAGRRALLFDDLYRSGATMNAIASALYDVGRVENVYALAVTRTRSKS
jgi:competence protein ComFC